MRTDTSDTQATEILTRDPDLAPHLEALGLKSVEAYTSWCARNGFSLRIDKHWRDRCKERYYAAQDAIKERLARQKQERRKPRRIIARILDGNVEEGDLTQPHLVLIHQTVAAIDHQQTKNALRELLLSVEGHSGLLATERAYPQFGAHDGNTFIGGLLGLVRNHLHWYVRSRRGFPGRTMSDASSRRSPGICWRSTRSHHLWIRCGFGDKPTS